MLSGARVLEEKQLYYCDLQNLSNMTSNMTSLDIDLHIYHFPSKALLHHIDNATDLSRKMLSPLEDM